MSHGIRKEISRMAVKVDELVPFDGNARRGDIAAIVESLETHGQYRPIVVRRDGGVVLAGNHTFAAVKEMGWTHVAVTWVDVDDEQAKRIVLVDNRTNDLAGYDDQALADLLEPLQQSSNALDGTGFSSAFVDDLLERINTPPQKPDDEDDPPPAVWGVGVACASEEARDELIARIEEWGHHPRKVDGRFVGQITE